MSVRGAGWQAFASAGRCYWLQVFPLARRELRAWRQRAACIPDPALRRDALFAHRAKGRRSEGLAAFAVLAPRVDRQRVIRGTVALESMLDYLDAISERPAEDPVANTLGLHRAVEVAVDVTRGPEDYYALHNGRDDGGYLAALIEKCHASLGQLPSYPAVAESLRRSAWFDAQAQSLSHGLLFGTGEAPAAAWAERTAGEMGLDQTLKWWEVVAAGASPLPFGALIAAAADPLLTAEDVARLAAAYFPWVAALSSLLDGLLDLGERQLDANPVVRYSSEEVAAERMGAIASRSLELVSELPSGELHELILAALGGYHLAQPNAWLPGRERIAASVLTALGRFARPALTVHCLRQGEPRIALRSVGAFTQRGAGPIPAPGSRARSWC
jgi:tetraprenyl-beta-curcumene synthase